MIAMGLPPPRSNPAAHHSGCFRYGDRVFNLVADAQTKAKKSALRALSILERPISASKYRIGRY